MKEKNIRNFINKSELEFKDISSEKYRKYSFPNGKTLKIKNPLFLNVSKSGSHRLFDAQKCSWYIKPDESWYIKWEVNEGNANFVK